MATKRPILFDFDGVLGKTYKLSWLITCSLHPEVSEETYRVHHHLGNVIEEPAINFTDFTREAYFRFYNGLLSREHIADAMPALARLKNDCRFHVVTSNCEVAIERVLTEVGVRAHFGHILGRAAHAQKVEKFERIAREEGFALCDALFITDTLGDLKEAEKVGLPAIGVTFGFHDRELLEQGAHLAIADTWDELVTLIKEY